MLYLYCAGITPRLLEVMAREPRILPYLDMPMQHASDAVLARMRRPERQRTIRDRVAQIRDVVPDVAIRTTCIVGFPGETDEDFEQLLEFLEEMQFERVGAFTYSPQEGTRAAEMADDVPESVKRERLERLDGAAAADHRRAVRARSSAARRARWSIASIDGERRRRARCGRRTTSTASRYSTARRRCAPGTIVDARRSRASRTTSTSARRSLRVVDRAGDAVAPRVALAARR